MKIMKLMTAIFLAITISSSAQDIDFISSTPRAIPDVGTMVDTMNVQTGWPTMNCQSFGIKSVHLELEHALPYQVSAYIVHDADTVRLFHQGALQTTPASITCSFSMLHQSIVLGEPPYDLDYSPIDNLGNLNSGASPNGDWLLVINDQLGGGYSGAINGWSLTFGTDSIFCPATSEHSDSNAPILVCNDSFNIACSHDEGYQSDSLFMDLGCLNTENSSTWFKFIVSQDGTLAFTLHSATNNDFSLWALDQFGEVTQPAIRCSNAIDAGFTGLTDTATTIADSVVFLTSINVVAGEQYLMLVNNNGFYSGEYNGSSMPTYLELTGSATFNCDISTTIEQASYEQNGFITLLANGIELKVEEPTLVHIMDLSGRSVYGPTTLYHTRSLLLDQGQVYLVRYNNTVTKVFIF